MSILSSTYKKSLRFFILASFAILLSPFFFGLNTHALATQGGVAINPSDFDPKEKFSKGWFVERLNPGDSVERSVTLSNNADTEKSVILSPEDYVQGGQGAYDFSDKQDLKGVGSWIQLAKTDITIPAQKAIAVKFTLKIPQNIKPGEYSGVLSIQEKPKDSQGSGFNVVSRVGSRIYITIPGDLQAGFQFDNFKFITPVPSYTDSQFYKDFLIANYNNPDDTLFLTMKFRNIGNVFTKLKGKIDVTTPDGKVVTSNFDRDYAAFDPFIGVPYFSTNGAKWTLGKWKAKFTFENPGLITSNKSELRGISPTQVVEAEFDMTQSVLDQYKADFKKAKEGKDLPKVGSSSSVATSDNGLQIKDVVSSSSSSENKSSSTSSNNVLYFVGGGIIILLLAVIIFLLLKKKTDKDDKSENESDSKKEDKSEEKSVKPEMESETKTDTDKNMEVKTDEVDTTKTASKKSSKK